MKKAIAIIVLAALAAAAVLLFRGESPTDIAASYGDGVLYYSVRNIPGEAELYLTGVGSLSKTVRGNASGTLRLELADGSYTLSAQGDAVSVSAQFQVRRGRSVTEAAPGETVQPPSPTASAETGKTMTVEASYENGCVGLNAFDVSERVDIYVDGEPTGQSISESGYYSLPVPLSAGRHSLALGSEALRTETVFEVAPLTILADYAFGELKLEISGLPGEARLLLDGEPTGDLFDADGMFTVRLEPAHGAHTVALDAAPQYAQAEIFAHSLARKGAKAPTCTEDGYTEGISCAECGYEPLVSEVLPALGHEEIRLEAREVSCTQDGLSEGLGCARCGEVLIPQQITLKLGHDAVDDPAVEATCTESGHTAGSHCLRCGETLVKPKELPALGHFSVYEEGVQPTCTEEGRSRGSHCGRCGVVLSTASVLPALGHIEKTQEGIEPTCTGEGLSSAVVCARCGEVLTRAAALPALGHDEKLIPAVAPTCTQEGHGESVTCARCGQTLRAAEVLPALGHEPAAIPAVEPTCTEEGCLEGSYCSRCGELLAVQEPIPALGHLEQGVEGWEASCTEDGLTDGVFCTRCGEILVPQQPIPALGHEIAVDEMIMASCETEGLTRGAHCERCGEVLLAQAPIPATGHLYGRWKTDSRPDCTAAGLEYRICARCGARDERELPMIAHNPLWHIARQAGNQEPGQKRSVCSRCGEVLGEEEIQPVPGHLSTATSEGLKISEVKRKYASLDEWKMVTPLVLNEESARSYPLVARNTYIAGSVDVDIGDGMLRADITVDHRMKLYSAALLILPDIDGIRDFNEASYESGFYSFPAAIRLEDLPQGRCVMLVICKLNIPSIGDSYPLYDSKSDAHKALVKELKDIMSEQQD